MKSTPGDRVVLWTHRMPTMATWRHTFSELLTKVFSSLCAAGTWRDVFSGHKFLDVNPPRFSRFNSLRERCQVYRFGR